MLANIFGPDLGVFVLIAIVVIFGGSQLPKIARNVGSAGKEFRKAQREAEEEEAVKVQVQSPPAVTAGPVPAPSVPLPSVTVPPVVAAAVAPSDDKVTISKAELAALLDERLGRADGSTASANSASTNSASTNEPGGFNN